MTQTIRLASDKQRELACKLVRKAPPNAIVTIKEETRSNEQNSLLWSRLSDVSRAKPQGRHMTPELWKCAFMNALGHQVRFEQGLDGAPFPVGFHSSRLNKAQMTDLISFVEAWGSENGVAWSDPHA